MPRHTSIAIFNAIGQSSLRAMPHRHTLTIELAGEGKRLTENTKKTENRHKRGENKEGVRCGAVQDAPQGAAGHEFRNDTVVGCNCNCTHE